MCEEWNARREALEGTVIAAVLDLFEHMGGAGAFVLPLLHGTAADLVVAAGPRDDAISMLWERKWGR
jgi:uncharacterized protein YqgC (DUF456 family)